jgi:hypothetical protein
MSMNQNSNQRLPINIKIASRTRNSPITRKITVMILVFRARHSIHGGKIENVTEEGAVNLWVVAI